MLAARAHWVAVDAFGTNLLPPPPLQGLVDAHNERSFGYEGFHEQPQQDAAYLPTRPDGAAEHPMVATEAPFLLRAHRSPGGGYGPLSRGEDCARQEQLDMLEDAFGEKWRERGQHLYYRSW
ncbi:MAG TPA: hypothetical protein VE525_09210 [Rubrobacter sp.]|nr:hypothetical protein [Rubrobacter sp.]